MANGLAIAGGENFWTALAGALSPSAAQGYNDVNLVSAGLYRWNLDTTLARLAAASMRQGGAPSATPVAQTFTLGEASRPGTDSDVGGSSGTVRSGLGTGTGTASSLIFQTPTLAASGTGTQAYATRMTIATTGITTTVQMFGPSGSQSAPDYSFTGSTNSGMSMFSTTFLFFSVANTTPGGWQTDTLLLSNNVGLTWVSGANASGTLDTSIARLAAASIRQGLAPSATPIAQTFTIGEASRPGTDANVGGANGTIRSGLGTGTGTASNLIFQTPTLAGAGTGVQVYGTRLTIAGTSVSLTPGATSNTGFLLNSNETYVLQSTGSSLINFNVANSVIQLGSGFSVQWSSTTATGSEDLGIARLAAASLRIGLAPNATPLANLLTIGEASRPGTDSNVSGAHGTVRSGLGTGNATGSTLAFQTPTPGASGSVAQTYTTRLTLSATGAVFDIVDQGLRINNQVDGAGASAGSLTNAPAAGNPTFWLPINIAGVVKFVPCW